LIESPWLHHPLMNLRRSAVLSAIVAWTVGHAPAQAESVPVPNYSLETPTTTYVNTNIDSWQKTDQPAWYDDGNGAFGWAQLTGIFKNTPVGAFDHLDNCDGLNAMWLFNVPQVGLFQDYNALDYNDATPTHAFAATYETGKSYTMIIGINGGGGGMPDGATLELSLYYLDDSGAHVPIAATTVINDLTNFPNHTHLTDFQVSIPVVKVSDPWQGHHIGIQFLSSVPLDNEDLQGGYWDLDNVRLIAVPAPPQVQCAVSGANVRVSWISLTGYQYQVQACGDLSSWVNSGAPQTGTGGELFQLAPLAGQAQEFFRVVVSPAP